MERGLIVSKQLVSNQIHYWEPKLKPYKTMPRQATLFEFEQPAQPSGELLPKTHPDIGEDALKDRINGQDQEKLQE